MELNLNELKGFSVLFFFPLSDIVESLVLWSWLGFTSKL